MTFINKEEGKKQIMVGWGKVGSTKLDENSGGDNYMTLTGFLLK
jgi:hypothetical protein